MAFLRSPEIGVSLPANAGYALATCGPGGGKSVWFALLVLGAGLLGVPFVWGSFRFGFYLLVWTSRVPFLNFSQK